MTNFSFQFLRIYSNLNGRFVIRNMESNGKFITLATTLYAPNEKDSNINFFRIFFDHLRDFKCEEIIVGRNDSSRF